MFVTAMCADQNLDERYKEVPECLSSMVIYLRDTPSPS